jgi:hypothetical protein
MEEAKLGSDPRFRERFGRPNLLHRTIQDGLSETNVRGDLNPIVPIHQEKRVNKPH